MPQREGSFTGPERATLADVDALNRLFSEAFTDRYHRDGMTGVRVPFLSREAWRFAIEDAGEGAMLWRDADGHPAAFNVAHVSGSEGWMGPLAVRPALQGLGLGRRIVRTGVSWLQARGATLLGLETMPRTVENIGFYGTLGFRPAHLTLTMQADFGHTRPPGAAERFSSAGPERAARLAELAGLTTSLWPGVDYSREITLTADLAMGDTAIVRDGGRVRGFGLWHTTPLALGRGADEVRVLKLVAEDLEAVNQVLGAVAEHSRPGPDRLSLRCQAAYGDLFAMLLRDGYLVQWTDLRMLLGETAERPSRGIVLSNWEI